MAPPGFTDHPIELEARGIPLNSRQLEPPKKRRSACDHGLMTGIRTRQRQRHHRVQVAIRAERGEHDLHAAMLSDGDGPCRARLDKLRNQAAIMSHAHVAAITR
jgi:hypothetical protein